MNLDSKLLYPRKGWVQSESAHSLCTSLYFANLYQANQANDMMIHKLINPLMSECFNWSEIPSAHTKMMENKHLPGNMAALVQAKKTEMTTLNDFN